MKARVISVGNELLKGETLDTNALFISRELARLGVETVSRFTCADDTEAIAKALLHDEGEKIVVVCGGLGPTDDDVTREAFAGAFSLELFDDPISIAEIENFFKRMGRAVTERNLRQGRLPAGSVRIKNEWGTAPGFVVENKGRVFYCLPGVPSELENIFLSSVTTDVQKRFGVYGKTWNKTFKVFGIPESALNDLVQRIKKPDGVSLGYYAKVPEIHLTLTYPLGDPGLEHEASLYEEEIRKVLKDNIFDEAGLKIEEKLVDALIKNKLTLSVAESCTGGMLAGMIVNVPGSSKCFDRAVVAYSDKAKVELLSVHPETIKDHGAVSSECALEMARGIKKLSGSHIGVSTTGIAGPGGATENKPVGATFIGISGSGYEAAHSFMFKRERNTNRLFTVYEVFTRLIRLVNNGNLRP